MDPLSITASTIAILHTVGIIATTLDGFVRSVRTVDTRITGLCEELTRTSTSLEAIHATVQKGQRLDFGQDDDALWQQGEQALVNCQTTLNELSLLVNKIKDNCQRKNFGWRVKAVVDLKTYSNDIDTAKDKLRKSNYALQTMLNTINVSLSLKNNESQHIILQELEKLKASISEALHASSRPVGGFHYHNEAPRPDSRITRNLRLLAEAAKHYHTAASSTAGTVRSDNGEMPWQSQPGADISLFGDFPVSSRERVEQFLFETPNLVRAQSGSSTYAPSQPNIHSTDDISRSASPQRIYIPTTTSPENFGLNNRREHGEVERGDVINEDDEGYDDEDDEDEELDLAFLEGLRDLATASLKNCEYDKAVQFFEQAMTHKKVDENDEQYRQMQIQLTLCYFMQGKWRLAEPIVKVLAQDKSQQSLVTCNLLHALALAHLSEYALDDALSVCKQALQGKRRLCKVKKTEYSDYYETLSLLCTIFDVAGDFIRAQVFRRQLPQDYEYTHPLNEINFMTSRLDVLESILGDDVPGYLSLHRKYAVVDRDSTGFSRTLTTSGMNGIALRKKLSEFEKYELDTSKEVVMNSDISSAEDADDEDSFVLPLRENSIKQRIIRLFRARSFPTNGSLPEHTNVHRRASQVSDISSVAASLSFKRFRSRFLVRRKATRRLRKTKKPETVVVAYQYPEVPGEADFRLLQMKRVTTPDLCQPSVLSRAFSWRAGQQDENVVSNGQESKWFDPDDVGLLPELADTEISVERIFEKIKGQEKVEQARGALAKRKIMEELKGYYRPDDPDEMKSISSGDSPSLHAIQTQTSQSDVEVEADMESPAASTQQCQTQNETDSTHDPGDTTDPVAPPPPRREENFAGSQNRDDCSQAAQEPPETMSTEMVRVLSELTSILSKLRDLEDPDELHMVVSSSKDLLLGFKPPSSHPNIMKEFDRAIKRLEVLADEAHISASDSGYESATSSSDVADSTGQNYPPGQDWAERGRKVKKTTAGKEKTVETSQELLDSMFDAGDRYA